MAFDLSWLWNLLDSISDTLNSWFSGIWTEVQNIANTGQGIFSGLVAFGSELWDAIVKFGQYFWDGLSALGDWIRQGLENAFDIFGEWLNNAYTYITQGVAWVGSQLYNFGNWLYNSLAYGYEWFVNTITSAWDNLVTWFSEIGTAISTWWASITSTVNTWFGSIITGFRAKMVETITADLTITMAWKGAERFFTAHTFKELGMGMMGLFASPVIGRLAGLIIDSVVPIPTSTTYPILPTISGFTYTPPSMAVTPPPERQVPLGNMPVVGPIGPTPTPSGYGLPYDMAPKLYSAITYTTSARDQAGPISAVDEETVDTSDATASINSTIETIVA